MPSMQFKNKINLRGAEFNHKNHTFCENSETTTNSSFKI